MNAELQERVEILAAGAGMDGFRIQRLTPVGGGCIHTANRVEAVNGERLFLKRNGLGALAMFEAESDGLRALAVAGGLRVPTVIGTGSTSNEAFLLLEWLDLGGSGAQRLLGEGLARIHRLTNPKFGWEKDNFIGETEQLNGWQDDWITFFRECRLEPQFRRARNGGLEVRGAERLLNEFSAFFDCYQPVPSLLHGDLWGGNAASTRSGEPVVFDPAVYFGDREADLAFTRMFGGFSDDFYEAYRQAWPLAEGWQPRFRLYNLYHELNHFNLFGGGYGESARSTVHALLAML